jgi:hypothetical protein
MLRTQGDIRRLAMELSIKIVVLDKKKIYMKDPTNIKT